MQSKIFPNVQQALAGIQSGMSIAFGGFGTSGVPYALIAQLAKEPVDNLTIYSNNPGGSDSEGNLTGLAFVVENNQVRKFVGSHLGFNRGFQDLFLGGKVSVELIPQGSFAERLRAGGAGIPAFFTPTGAGTAVAEGGVPTRYNEQGEAIEFTQPKEVRTFTHNGQEREYVLEEAIQPDYAMVHAWKADAEGNVVFRKSSTNFNPDMAKAARVTVVEAEHIVPVGSLDPSEIHLPGIFVDRVYPLTKQERDYKPLGILQLTDPESSEEHADAPTSAPSNAAAGWSRQQIAKRAGQELSDGEYVNLGIGLPTLVANYVPKGVEVRLQSENGILHMGPAPLPWELDQDVCNAGKETVTIKPGGSTFDSSTSFSMIRGGYINTVILGAFEVSEYGDLANWAVPGKLLRGMGGAMDLVQGAQRVVVIMEHLDPEGNSRIKRECTYPLTGKRVVDRIITSMGVFDVTDQGLSLVELAPGITVDQVRAATDAPFEDLT
ncbi:3-oxoacid CoA-transferase [Corynebacterium kozikiae]|uniref:3-oxoacid CoA-transferase n=1 Tax=Corynebacterium kozikiae TaxID=2968469 RepID=UPI00211C2A22|nr:3-oxoacid CoA-transferase [Corynebacterium sp. 76QC2CO]MCQ9343001.1 3-oxoacid CoA-transferase [Corynebacterium sp. 76QC2CO]